MKRINTFEGFLNEKETQSEEHVTSAESIDEAIKDVRLTKETADMIWDVIVDASEEAKSATSNSRINFVSGSTDVYVQNPTTELWAKIRENQKKWNIGQISLSSDQALVMITEGNVVKGYLTCTLDINKQKFKGNSTSLFAIPNIQNFVQQRFFKHIAYSA